MNLGILYKDNKIINHRSLFKVLMNPICRYFGFCFGTIYKNNKLFGYKIIKQKRTKIKWDFSNHNQFDYIEKRRMII